MKTLTATQARKEIYRLLDEAAETHEPIQITGKRSNATLVSEDGWRSIQETIYLSSIPGMSESIKEGILLDRITKQSDICHGKPTIRGLRYPVGSMLDLMASGMSIKEILEDYPDLEKEDLLACMEYAARLTQTKRLKKIAQ